MARVYHPRDSQKGIALIMVLLVLALIATLATSASSRVQFNIKKAQNSSQRDQAYWYALGGETLAQQLIIQDKIRDERIYFGQAWSLGPHQYPFEGGGLELRIDDQQACFNINALATLRTSVSKTTQPIAQSLRQFRSLLVLLDFEEEQIIHLAQTIQDWLDKDLIPTGHEGVEDLYYTGLNPPYRTANAPIADLSELNLITGFKAEHLARLAPYLCALPNQQLSININSLKEEQGALLSALFEGALSVEDATLLLQSRPLEGFTSVDEFWQQIPMDAAQAGATVKPQLTATSDFFLATIDVSYYDARLRLISRLGIKEDKVLFYSRRYGVIR